MRIEYYVNIYISLIYVFFFHEVAKTTTKKHKKIFFLHHIYKLDIIDFFLFIEKIKRDEIETLKKKEERII